MNQPRQDVLNGWKEIASYLGRDPRTVERWEKQRLLPVRRLPGSGRASIYALKSELDDWLAQAPTRSAEPLAEFDHESPSLLTGESEPAAVRPEAFQLAAVQPAQTEAPARETGLARPPALLNPVWRLTGTFLLAVCCLTLAALGWHHVHRAAPSGSDTNSQPAKALRSRIVPSSAVPGVEEFYLRACYQAEQRTPDSLNRALGNFQSAIAKDPTYAPAFAGLASTFVLLREYSLFPDSEAYPKAKAAAQRAIALDPQLAEPHAELGFVEFFWDWEPAQAETEFRTALRLDPELPLSHHWFGSVLAHEGRFGEALPELKVAQHLNPSSGAILTVYALALGMDGKRGEASDMLQEALSNADDLPDRNPATMHSVLGLLSLMRPSDIPRFLAETTRGAQLRGDARAVANLQRAEKVYKAQGEAAMWRAMLTEEKRQHLNQTTYAMARYEARLGARDEALTHLAVLAARHDPEMIGISTDPLLSGLHNEPRFQRIRASMHLPPIAEPT